VCDRGAFLFMQTHQSRSRRELSWLPHGIFLFFFLVTKCISWITAYTQPPKSTLYAATNVVVLRHVISTYIIAIKAKITRKLSGIWELVGNNKKIENFNKDFSCNIIMQIGAINKGKFRDVFIFIVDRIFSEL